MRGLSKEIGVSRYTLRTAIHALREEGMLVPGKGETYSIANPDLISDPNPSKARTLRLTVLYSEPPETMSRKYLTNLMELTSNIRAAGHEVVFLQAPSFKDRHGTGHLPRLVKEHPSDGWIIVLGNEEVLRWFSNSGIPAFALGGRFSGLPIAAAGTDMTEAMRTTMRRLVAGGHRRIVLITGSWARHPAPADFVEVFRAELETAGIRMGGYHLPDWEQTPDGLVRLTESLFKFTPPTALIITPNSALNGTLTWCGQKGIRVPDDVSIVSMCWDNSVNWCLPGKPIAHMECDGRNKKARLLEWVNNISEGKKDVRQNTDLAVLKDGESIAPAKRG